MINTLRNMPRIQSRFWIPGLFLIAALLGMGLLIYATTYGPGIGGDATIYLTTARNLLDGKGLIYPEPDGTARLLPYTPPFYPIVLSAVGLLVKDMTVGARWLNVLLFGATIFLVGWFFYRAVGRPWLAAILAGVLATSPVILGVQVWAMSESIFLLLGFTGLFLLLEHLECPRPVLLVGAALLTGLSLLTRYFGVAFVIAAGLALLFLGRGEDRRLRLSLRWPVLREGLLFGVIASVPTLIWLVIDFAATGTVGSRSGQPVSAYWQRFLEIGPALQKIYLFWLLPDSLIPRLPGIVQVLLWLVPLALVVLAVVLLAKRLASPASQVAVPVQAKAVRLAAMAGLFILVYLLVLTFVQVLTYPPITLAARMLSPVHIAVLVLLFALLALLQVVFTPNKRAVQALVYLGCLALLGMYGLRGGLVARNYHQEGIGYLAPAWKDSITVHYMSTLPANVPIISNETTAAMFFAGRPAYTIQEIYANQPAKTFSVYGSGDDAGQKAFREQGGALVLFNNTLEDDFGIYGDRVDERLQALTRGLYLYYSGPDGAIYFFKRPAFVPAEDCG